MAVREEEYNQGIIAAKETGWSKWVVAVRVEEWYQSDRMVIKEGCGS